MVLVHLAVALLAVVAASRALRPLCRATAQPTVVADMAAGILLGPSLLGWIAPGTAAILFPPDAIAPLGHIAQVGVVLYMFLVGAELDFDHARAHARSNTGVALAGFVVPVILGAVLGAAIDPGLMPEGPPRWQPALFMGVAMAMTAFPVLARILTDTRLMATALGARALSCAAIADVIVWASVGLLVGTLERPFGNLPGVVWAPVVSALFVGGMLLVVRPLTARVAAGPIGRGPLGLPVALAAVGVVAFVAEWAGVHAVVGAFLLGIGVPHDSALARTANARMSLAVGMVLPAFFAIAGLRTHIGLVQGISGWLTCLAIIMVATIGKLGATAVAARASGSGWLDAARLGVLMNVRGLMEIVVLNVGLDLGLVSPSLYTMMVLMALTTTVMAVPAIRVLAKGSVPS